MKKITLLILLSFLVLFVPPLQTVRADDPSPWGEFLNPDGSIQWDKLVDLGVSSQEAGWMDVTLPGGVVIQQQATFHRYQTPSGNVLVLPEPVTLFFMALHPAESGLTGAESMLGNGASILTLLVGGALTPDQLAQLVSKGYTDPMQFFQAVIDGREDIWSIVNFNFLGELFKMTKDSGFLVNALLLYLNGTANCADIPGGCSGLNNTACTGPTCVPQPSLCPAASIVQGTPELVIQKIAPDHPLVVGQDPAKRGADIQISAVIPPVVFTWYQPVQDPPTCHASSDGKGSGCPGPGSRYRGVYDQNGGSISYSAGMENNPGLAGRAGSHSLRAPRGASARDDHRGESHGAAQPGEPVLDRERPGREVLRSLHPPPAVCPGAGDGPAGRGMRWRPGLLGEGACAGGAVCRPGHLRPQAVGHHRGDGFQVQGGSHPHHPTQGPD